MLKDHLGGVPPVAASHQGGQLANLPSPPFKQARIISLATHPEVRLLEREFWEM
jgi:hypothetical protein